MASSSSVARQHLRVSYEQLVTKQQFDKIMDVLLKEQNSDALRLWLEGKMPSTIQPTENTGETALHRIAVVQPPAWIVEALVNCLTELYHNSPLDVTDVLGRTPLHIATIYGSTDAIPILTNGTTVSSFITAPLIQDKWLRCPLHWACTHPIRNRNTRAMDGSGHINTSNEKTTLLAKLICQPRNDTTDMFDAVRTLLAAYPEATIIRDLDCKTPLELAIEYNADPSIIRMVSTMERSVRAERHDFDCHTFWGSKNGETTSMSVSETEFAAFPDGFPGEINFQTARTIGHGKGKTKRFDYKKFEC